MRENCKFWPPFVTLWSSASWFNLEKHTLILVANRRKLNAWILKCRITIHYVTWVQSYPECIPCPIYPSSIPTVNLLIQQSKLEICIQCKHSISPFWQFTIDYCLTFKFHVFVKRTIMSVRMTHKLAMMKFNWNCCSLYKKKLNRKW